MSTNDQMPPLPEADHVIHVTDSETMDCFRSDQMHAYARTYAADLRARVVELEEKLAQSEARNSTLSATVDVSTRTLELCAKTDRTLAARRSPGGEGAEAVGRCVGCQAEQGAPHASGCKFAPYV
jgi:hypothetical protein